MPLLDPVTTANAMALPPSRSRAERSAPVPHKCAGRSNLWTSGIPRLLTPMPRDGSLTLSEVHGPTLCEECGRRGRYNVERLIAAHGDAKLTDLLTTLADCDKARSFSIYDRCKAVYEGL